MAQFMPIIFLGIIYGIWKWLDSMQLPNTISIILVALVIICGGFWAFYKFSADPRRKQAIAQQQKRLGRALTEEEMAEIQPKSAVGEFFASLFGILFFVTVLRSFLFEPFQIPSGSMEPTLRVGDFLVVNKFSYGIKDPIWQNTLIETGKPQRGDVIVFKPPKSSLFACNMDSLPVNLSEEEKLKPAHTDYIKRVIGVGGDKVKYDSRSQQLTVINGDSGKEIHFQYSDGKDNPNFFYSGSMQVERTETGSVTHQILNHPYPINYFGKEVMEWEIPEGYYFTMGDNRDASCDSRFWGFVPEQYIVGKATFIWLSLDKKANEFPTGLRFSRMFTSIN